MYVVESKEIREVLEFRFKSLLATGMPELAAIIKRDLEEILRKEIYVKDDRK